MRLLLTIALLSLAGPAVAGSPWAVGAELGAGYDSNAGNAHTPDDTRSNATILAGINSTHTQRVGEYSAIQLRVALDDEGDTGIHDLSNARASLRLRLLHKPGEGFYVPVLAVTAGGGYRESVSTIRSGDDWRVGGALSEPLTTQVSTRISYDWMRRDARGRSFDGQTHSYGVSLDWAVLPQLSLYGEYRYDRGPIVVSAEGIVTPKTEHLYLYPIASSVEPDPAFGDDWFAYRLEGTTQIATLGANLPLSQDLSLDVQVRRAHSVAETYGTTYSSGPGPGGMSYTGFDYNRWLGGLSLLWRW